MTGKCAATGSKFTRESEKPPEIQGLDADRALPVHLPKVYQSRPIGALVLPSKSLDA